MKTATRTATVLLSLLMLATSAFAAEPLHVTTSFYPLYIAALNVTDGIDAIDLANMAPVSAGCLHDYQLTTTDRRVLSDSDVIILSGTDTEAFLDTLLPTLPAAVVDAGAGISLLGSRTDQNTHIWVSLPGMMRQVQNIADGLSEIDPDNAAAYQENAAAYIKKLEALYSEMQETLAPFAGTPIVTFHEAFDYFARDFNLRIVATVQSHHGSAPSARELASLADTIEQEGVRALFAEPDYEDPSVDTLSRETGLPIYLLDPATGGALSMDAYLDIMRQNMNTLAEALS